LTEVLLHLRWVEQSKVEQAERTACSTTTPHRGVGGGAEQEQTATREVEQKGSVEIAVRVTTERELKHDRVHHRCP
jgi:hypothetical protein